jgi:hypothetical protein
MPPEQHTSVVPDRPQGSPADYGQLVTDDFQVYGNLKLAYQGLKEMFEPKVHSESGPIKPLTQAEKDREANKPLEDAASEIPPTITSA